MVKDGSIKAAYQMDTNDASLITDFAGKKVTAKDWLSPQRIKVTPTLLFFGVDGKELAPRLEGVSIPDFYVAYLDERLETANKRVI